MNNSLKLWIKALLPRAGGICIQALLLLPVAQVQADHDSGQVPCNLAIRDHDTYYFRYYWSLSQFVVRA